MIEGKKQYQKITEVEWTMDLSNDRYNLDWWCGVQMTDILKAEKYDIWQMKVMPESCHYTPGMKRLYEVVSVWDEKRIRANLRSDSWL